MRSELATVPEGEAGEVDNIVRPTFLNLGINNRYPSALTSVQMTRTYPLGTPKNGGKWAKRGL